MTGSRSVALHEPTPFSSCPVCAAVGEASEGEGEGAGDGEEAAGVAEEATGEEAGAGEAEEAGGGLAGVVTPTRIPAGMGGGGGGGAKGVFAAGELAER